MLVKLQEYLEQKPLYYENIDYSRMPRIYHKIESFFTKVKIVHVIGTNGKGTTGRFLADALFSMGFKTGHYTSPHILEFNERVWINGENATNQRLEDAHLELQKILTKDDAASLSYFEYTTFLAMIIFRECDYVVMEAGLGGEFDATAVFPKTLTLVTPIAYDHEAFLGSDIEQIATTKLKAIQNSAIISYQKFSEVYVVADKLKKSRALNIYKMDDFLDEADRKNIDIISKNLSLVAYLTENLSLSISALKFLQLKYKTTHFKSTPLFGRITKLTDNIVVDVGHNSLAAKAIVSALKEDDSKYIVVYNSYRDKNYKEILSILKPIVLHVEIIDVDDNRIEYLENIQKSLDELSILHKMFNGIQTDKKYLIFGSFSVVEAFLREYYE